MQAALTVRRVAGLLGLVVMLAGLSGACRDTSSGDDDDDGDDDDGPSHSSKPQGAAECVERYFAKRSQECLPGECGDTMTCTSDWDCLTCADRCTVNSCSSAADCEEAYGHLCGDVEWRCEGYIVQEDQQCAVYDKGAPECGDGTCEGDETCDSCHEDCGYCPGTAPGMAACSSDSECASGWCDDWCVLPCGSGWDCVGDGQGVLYGDCVMANDNNWYCFPSCGLPDSGSGGCGQYPGTVCKTLQSSDGYDVSVCSS
ncbi:MAG: hypothetical protein HOV80_06790 [Polyangiaceae bacterium]|nr:hypothetical protein [Polyangiaceae bacterium]